MTKNIVGTIECPYCHKVFNFSHPEPSIGDECWDDTIFRAACDSCGKIIRVEAVPVVTFDYVLDSKLECVNGLAPHEYSESGRCNECGHTDKAINEEYKLTMRIKQQLLPCSSYQHRWSPSLVNTNNHDIVTPFSVSPCIIER